MAYKVISTRIPEVMLLQPQVHGDNRGFFLESFNQRDFEAATGVKTQFVQDNHSKSLKGVMRGLHFQTQHAQGKLVRVTAGTVFDVAVDIRPESSTFGQWTGHTLSAENFLQLWIPPGFAHGFLVLSEHAEFQYKTTDYYAPAFEKTLYWKDPEVAIDWPDVGPVLLADKDKEERALKLRDLAIR